VTSLPLSVSGIGHDSGVGSGQSQWVEDFPGPALLRLTWSDLHVYIWTLLCGALVHSGTGLLAFSSLVLNRLSRHPCLISTLLTLALELIVEDFSIPSTS
jgi:hypothetical protein